jgi:hypothetical protein
MKQQYFINQYQIALEETKKTIKFLVLIVMFFIIILYCFTSMEFSIIFKILVLKSIRIQSRDTASLLIIF